MFASRLHLLASRHEERVRDGVFAFGRRPDYTIRRTHPKCPARRDGIDAHLPGEAHRQRVRERRDAAREDDDILPLSSPSRLPCRSDVAIILMRHPHHFLTIHLPPLSAPSRTRRPTSLKARTDRHTLFSDMFSIWATRTKSISGFSASAERTLRALVLKSLRYAPIMTSKSGCTPTSEVSTPTSGFSPPVPNRRPRIQPLPWYGRVRRSRR